MERLTVIVVFNEEITKLTYKFTKMMKIKIFLHYKKLKLYKMCLGMMHGVDLGIIDGDYEGRMLGFVLSALHSLKLGTLLSADLGIILKNSKMQCDNR